MTSGSVATWTASRRYCSTWLSTWIATELARLVSSLLWALVSVSVARASLWREKKKIAPMATTMKTIMILVDSRHSLACRTSVMARRIASPMATYLLGLGAGAGFFCPCCSQLTIFATTGESSRSSE